MNKGLIDFFNNPDNIVYPGHKLKGKERYRKLYHFTSFESFVKIWLSKELKFGSTINVNDIQESGKFFSVKHIEQLPIMCAFIDKLSLFRQISFTMDTDSYLKGFMNTMMWGYYGDKSRGVCIEFDYDKIIFPKGIIKGVVKYTDFPQQFTEIPSNITTLKQVNNYISKNIHKLFFCKQTGWKGENEYRVISSKEESLNIENSISCVYLTSCTSKECLWVEKLVKDPLLVKYLDFNNTSSICLPIDHYTKTSREEIIGAQNDPNNTLEHFKKQAWDYYEKHKNDENFSLILKTFSLCH